MSINLRNISVSVSLPLLLLLLLLIISIVAAGSVPSGFGQNTSPNITTSDVVDLFDNGTDRVEGDEAGEDDNDNSNFPQLNNDDDNSNNNSDNDNDNNDENSDDNSNSISSSPSASSSSPSSSSSSSSSPSSLTTSQPAIMINEIELNPPGEYDKGKEWIELYNPTEDDINISNFVISTSSESATIELPPDDAIIEAGETYVIELEEQILSNTVDSLVLANAAGEIQDRTPSLVDRSDDDRTWQRIRDGNNEWQFVENTKGNSNSGDDNGNDSDSPSTTGSSAENTEGNADDESDTLSRLVDSMYSRSEEVVVECHGSAGCVQGVVTRIVDGDTLYVEESNSSATYKVDLALADAPSRSEGGFVESTGFTRDLCLGSTVLVDEDDMSSSTTSSDDSGIVGVVYCSSANLNEELLDNGYAELEVQQCATSEFANELWVKDHGC